MAPQMMRLLTSALLLFVGESFANVTVYGTRTTDASGAVYTQCIGAVACDGRVLTPIGAQEGFNPTVPIQLNAGGMEGLSIGISGAFAGFSVELSISDKVFGGDGEHVEPKFLNLMSTLTSRTGELYIRVGGNTQDKAVILPGGLPDGKTIEKADDVLSTTSSPRLLVSPNILHAMASISSFLPIKWFLGLPFNDTQIPRPEMGELGESILGEHLLGLQLGNEPDLYGNRQIRASDYNVDQYHAEWGQVLQTYKADSKISNTSAFIAPSVCCAWLPEQVWDTGFLDDYRDDLAYISVEHYPTNNCNTSGTVFDPQELLDPMYLNHTFVRGLNAMYINTTTIAQGIGKPVVMFETDTASCSGFSGLSDSFIATMWTVDHALNMAWYNFSNALFHVGGQNGYYNAFTPTATNQSHMRQWTVGSTFYSFLALAEILGSAGTAQVVDLQLNDNNQYTPGYAIYENGNPERVVLTNYLTDPSGASNYTAYVSIGGNNTGMPSATPSSVQVKYLLAGSAADKFGITWAGQTFGGPFESDGLLRGDEIIYTYQCDTANNVCPVPVPAPAVAVVFLNSDALNESGPKTTQSFATTATPTAAANTATVDQAILATSNGRGGGKWNSEGSASYGSLVNGAKPIRTNSILLSAVPTVMITIAASLTIISSV